jgi:hypothetical protein
MQKRLDVNDPAHRRGILREDFIKRPWIFSPWPLGCADFRTDFSLPFSTFRSFSGNPTDAISKFLEQTPRDVNIEFTRR